MATPNDRVRLADHYLDLAIRHLQSLPNGREALLLALKARASLLERHMPVSAQGRDAEA